MTGKQNTTTRIREVRELQGLSARELAYFSGCSAMTLSRLERGVSENVAPAVKARIARALRVPVEELWPQQNAESGVQAAGRKGVNSEPAAA